MYGIKPVELKFANWYINKLLKVCDIYLRAYLINGCKMAYYCLLWLYTHLIDCKIWIIEIKSYGENGK